LSPTAAWAPRQAGLIATLLLIFGSLVFATGLPAAAETDEVVVAEADSEVETPGLRVVPGSNINLLARETSIPITIENPTEAAALVLVRAKTESFRLEVLADTTIEVPALSSVVAQVPVRAIANGPVTLRVWLTVDGEPVGEDYVVGVNVNYDVEVFLLVTFGVALFGLIVIGIFRTASKLRGRLGS
jgi:hypothetical protein